MHKIKEIHEEEIVFDNGCILKSYHETDCCESHYLDFGIMESYNVSTVTGKPINIYEQQFDFSKGIPFTRVEGTGILLEDIEGNKYLINGYGCNNGYYSSEINLIYNDPDNKTIYDYDVTECQDYYGKDEYYGKEYE